MRYFCLVAAAAVLAAACGGTRDDSIGSGSGGSGAGATGAGAGGSGAGATGAGAAGAGSAGAGATGGLAGGKPAAVGGTSGLAVAPVPVGELKAELQQQLAAANEGIAQLAGVNAEELSKRYPFVAGPALDYDPSKAEWLDRIQASSLGLNAGELSTLGKNGFVISDRESFPDFTYGYKTIYFEHLPVYVSADSLLYAVHRSYDALLKSVEQSSLIPTLQNLLLSMLTHFQSANLSAVVKTDLSLYLNVARGLLSSSETTDEASSIVAQAKKGTGTATVSLFGVDREIDFSQFTPRGHYADQLPLSNYFRTMMWLGRTDFQLVTTQADHSRKFNRRQLESMVALRALMNDADFAAWKSIDDTVSTFVGEPDAMTLPQVDQLLAELGVKTPAELGSVPDDAIVKALEKGRYGVQRIASYLMEAGNDGRTLELNTSFAFLGQRYVIDSHVFSNVTFDRVPQQASSPTRLMPNPLDVAFAALGNNQAGVLLRSELNTYGYAPFLGSTRLLVDEHPKEYWDSSLYTLWLGALRSLSPTEEAKDPRSVGLPLVAGTEAWGRRLLNTQMASWAELRHDTLLYAKQSYSSIPSCDYPDAYVDPYPEVFAKLGRYADLGAEALAKLSTEGSTPSRVQSYFGNLKTVASTLESMARHQRAGEPYSEAELAFINDAVRVERVSAGCTTIDQANGWYAKLFFNPDDAIKPYPTIADVHTQPADEGGNPVGRVLHVGTAGPRLMVVTADTCKGPRAYVGLVSSYFEQTTTGFKRLTDQDWSSSASSSRPTDVPWMTDLVVR